MRIGTNSTLFCGLLLSLVSLMPLSAQAQELDNKEALQGITEIHTLYDVRKSNPNVMLAYLKGIETNHKNLLKEGVKPNLRVVFISSAVKFITTKPSEEVEFQHAEVLPKIKAQIARLINLGVKMEACSAATAYFKVDNDTLYPGIKPVRSGFLSVMGWQAQGYALVPVY
ncbi:DsrE family protein [Hydrogenovibrio kuenenii]|uniref:DsrE family protein n=1 Tax=Hydrogenovibrio kuenenii TaxID=63658 RepID=UPI000467CA24|nr:DsrE family protein [Hydrogenovibrio kuenenii]